MAASAVVRALESSSPSRLATARLLAEALLLYARTGTSDPHRPTSRAAEMGSRALINCAVHALLVLPCRGGALSRRALALLTAASDSADASAMLGVAERARTHMSQLRPSGIDEDDRYLTAAFVSAARAVGETSRSERAGRHCAEESVRSLLGVRGNRRIRGIAAREAAVLLESFPTAFAPDTRLLDAVLDALFHACSPNTIAKGFHPDAGVALLAAAVAPRLFSRPQQVEKLLRCLAITLPAVSGNAKGVWAIALVRVAFVARAARVKRPLRPEFEKRVKKDAASRSSPPTADAQLFETVTVTIARVCGLAAARAGATLALIASLRCWVASIVDAGMIARVVALLAPEVGSVAAASMLRDALCEAVISRWPPSLAYNAVRTLSELHGVHGRVSDALVVDLCSVMLRKYGSAAVVPPEAADADDRDYKSTPALHDELVGVARIALASNFAAGRLAGVRLVTALASAVPHERVPLLTFILQGLRIGDLRLDGADGVGLADLISPRSSGAGGSTTRTNSVSAALSAVLGNAVALAALVEECACCQWSEEPVPSAVLRQVAMAAIRLMRPLPPPEEADKYRERVATAVRRRAGWAVFTALARAGAVEECVPGGVGELCRYWRDDLRNTSIGEAGDIIPENEEVLAEAAMRCAALAALASCLRHEPSQYLNALAPHFVGATAARVAQLCNPDPDAFPRPEIDTQDSTVLEDTLFYRASLNTLTPISDSSTPDNTARLSLTLLHHAEAVQLSRCAVLAPPRGPHAALAYHVVASLAIEAANALADDQTQQPGVVATLLGAVPKSPDSTFAHRRVSLATLRAHGLSECNNVAKPPDEPPQNLAWLCSTEGVELPVAEEALVLAARAVASIVVAALPDPADEVPHAFANSPFTETGPIAAAVVALAVAARIHASALAASGRVLAALQVIVSRALKDVQPPSSYSVSSMPSSAVESHWSGTCINSVNAPGSVLRAMAGGHAEPPPPLLYNSACTRTVAISLAAQTVTAAAFRVLAEKGGDSMWAGLVRSACVPLTQTGPVPSAAFTAAASAANIVGALLALGGSDAVIEQAVLALTTSLEKGSSAVQAAAARAIPVCAATARHSERIITALGVAWANNDGTNDPYSHTSEWESHIDRVAHRVLKIEENTSTLADPFIVHSYAPNVAPTLALGATHVLNACDQYPDAAHLTESTLLSAAEICIDLLHYSEAVARTIALDALVAIWRVRMRRTNGVVPIQRFSIRTQASVGSSAGLFLEDAMYSALQAGSLPLAAAASRATAFMVARAGARAVAKNFSRIPEILFKAVADGARNAQQLLEVLAHVDAPDPTRIKYWIGLSRAVVLGMRRLNAKPLENWDVDKSTRALAVRIIRISVTASLARCSGAPDSEQSGILICVRETLDALVSIIRIRPVEPDVLAEATAVLQTFATCAQCRDPTQELGMAAVDALFESWPNVTDALSDLLAHEHAHQIVQLAAAASAHWLLLAPFIAVEDHHIVKLVTALADREPAAIARRFQYLEKSDTCGTATVAAVAAALGRVAATRALHARLFGRHSLDSQIERAAPALKNITSALLADHATFWRTGDGGLRLIAALAFSGPPPERLCKAIWPYVPILAAAACALANTDAKKNVENVSWLDDAAPAVDALRGIEGTCDVGRLVLAYSVSTGRDEVFDPAHTFDDVVHYAAMHSVHALPLREQDAAAALVDRIGRSVTNVLFDGVETFGVLRCPVVPSASRSKTSTRTEWVLDVVDEEEDDAPVVVGEAPPKVPEPRKVDSTQADGRLLRMPIDNSLNDTAHRVQENEAMPAAVIAFDELGTPPLDFGPDGEAAEPFANVATEAVRIGDVVHDGMTMNNTVGDTIIFKPNIAEPREAISSDFKPLVPDGVGESVVEGDTRKLPVNSSDDVNGTILHDVELDEGTITTVEISSE